MKKRTTAKGALLLETCQILETWQVSTPSRTAGFALLRKNTWHIPKTCILDAHSVPRGEITNLAAFGISILAFRDPDNIQLELTAPLTNAIS